MRSGMRSLSARTPSQSKITSSGSTAASQRKGQARGVGSSSAGAPTHEGRGPETAALDPQAGVPYSGSAAT
jgi:hypothetical protein